METHGIMTWHNFRTGQDERFTGLPTTAEGLRDYLPQDYAAQSSFALRIEVGMTPLDAYLAVLDVMGGDRKPGDTTPGLGAGVR